MQIRKVVSLFNKQNLIRSCLGHRRLSPVTLLRYAALCTVGQLARKIS